MEEKVKVLFILDKKPKKNTPTSIQDYIKEKTPDIYEFIYGVGDEDSLNQIDKHQPKIIFLPNKKSLDSLKLLYKIKQLHPSIVVFIMIFEMVDDEQETIDEYMASGAYKCFLQPLMIDSLVHDMYVALNLE